MRMFSALPAYQGGKRRLIGKIFKHMPTPVKAPVLVDAFSGGASVSLYAKARGYRVLANDIALRSEIVGRALIENDKVTLDKEDVTRLFMTNGGDNHFVEENFAPNVLTTKHAQFLDNAFPVARKAPNSKKWLLLLLLLKYILRLRPMGNFGAKTIVQQAERGEWENMNQHYVRDMLVRGIANHPKTVAETLRKQINKGVFSNGQRNEVHRVDVFEFLENVHGDLAYLDPPYAGTSAYETALRPLDSMLEGRLVKPERSGFSKAGAVDLLKQLLASAEKFPIWVLSYGNVEMNLEQLVKLVKRFRPVVVAEEFKYTHLTGLSGEEHRERNRELLVVARR